MRLRNILSLLANIKTPHIEEYSPSYLPTLYKADLTELSSDEVDALDSLIKVRGNQNE